MGFDRRRGRGVSEFTGVAILVSVTVLVTASIGVLVLIDDGDDAGADQADFSFEHIEQADVLIVSHEHGGTFHAGNLTLRSDGAEARWNELAGTNGTAPVGPGDSVQLSRNNAYGEPVRGSDEIQVVHRAGSANETVLDEWEGR